MKNSSAISRIAAKFSNPQNVSKAVEAQKARQRTLAAYEAPANPAEETAAAIWAKLLAIDRVGRNDDFFLMGGHSLLATQMLARVRDAFNVELPLRALFEAPVLASFAEKIESSRNSGAAIERPRREARGNTTPVSYAQQRFWFLDQLAPGNPYYNIPQRYRLLGKLNREALQKAIDALVRRQESLRTTFAPSDSGPVQVIAPAMELPVRHFDLTHLEEAARESEAQRMMQEDAVAPFDLAAGPLFRVLIIKLADDVHEMVLNIHHIVFDRWSHTVLIEEISEHYKAACAGTGDPFGPLPVQYADYTIWQRRYLEGGVLDRQVGYWKERLAGAPALIEFPPDRPRTATDLHRGAIEEFELPAHLLSGMREICQEEGCTLFMGLFAVFNVLLARYSGLEDIVVGSPIANRNLTEIEPLIGLFINTLVLRTDLSGNPAFRELLGRVRETCLGAYANETVPFERLVEELQLERSLSYNPIFQVMFALQPGPVQAVELPELRMERRPLHAKSAVFDSVWFAYEMAGGILLRVEYNTDLFDSGTIRRAVKLYTHLLEGVVAAPENRIAEVELLTGDERRKVVVEFNETTDGFEPGLRLQDFVERQVAKAPEAIALVCGVERVTYAGLNARANRIAHALMRRGVGPDVLVGVYMERTSQMLAAILGILKAGGAYVPLDPNYPKERVAHILQGAKAQVVLTQLSLAAGLPPAEGAEIICTDAAESGIEREPAANPAVPVGPEHLAYVLFTSGSTGHPKGVAIEHHSAATLVHWANRVFTQQELAGVLLSTSICFDLSIFEIFVTWSAGGKVILAENALHLPTLEAKNEVTLINTVPSAMAELLRMQAIPSSVKVINLAGEALPETLVEQIYAVTPVEKVYNLYGPTEDTTYSTYTLVPRGARVTVGRPIANTQAYITDAQLSPVPIGVPGELYLAGEGLARGYYGRGDLTTDRFVPNPFSARSGARMYRTGDVCRWQPDGNIQYLGRIDHQVKVRGFRIELGEIESTLDSHPGVSQSVVIAREDEPGNQRLVAYVAPDPNYRGVEDPGPDDGLRIERGLVPQLRRWVGDKLPQFMVPSAIVLLDSLPLSPNGKINRRALPAPEQGQETGVVYVAPRTPLEERLCAIWAEVLRLPRVGIQDNFFASGGHSLLATQVVSRVRQATAVELPLRFIFESPTIEQLSGRIEKIRAERAEELAPIPRVPRDQPLPLSFAQQRLWFLDQLDPNSASYNVPWTIRMRGALRLDALHHALNEIVRRHEIFRTTFTAVDGRPFQVIAPELTLDLPLADLSGVPAENQEAEIRRLVLEDVSRPFNLLTGPVLRGSLLSLNSEDHVLLLNSHHIANDGWSLWQFMKDLGESYEAFCEGRPSTLRELPIQYADYAAWQSTWMDGKVLETQLSFWKKYLEGAPDTLELPTDYPRPAVLSYRGAMERLVFPKSLSDKLNVLSRGEDATLYMTLLAAFQTLLFRYTGQEDIVLGSPIANRTRSDIEGLIGFFVNTLVMRTDISGNPTFRELLRRVRESSLGAYTNQDLPFEKLVEVLRPDRYLGRVPLFQVWFALQNAPRTSFRLPGIELTAMDVHNGTSKFDLGLFVVEKPEGLICNVEYSTDLFERTTIQRLLGHFGELLEAVTANPDQQVAYLPLLGEPERRQVVTGWNDTRRDVPRDRPLHQFIEEQVERSPDAPALVFESQALTYRELNARANQLAHRLRELGVGPETMVAVCAERSIEMVVALLGTMKAGGAYVPIDPDYPRSRLAVMLEDAEPRVLLTLGRLLDVLPAHSIPTICLDRDWHTLAGSPAVNPPLTTAGKDQAYMIYTSGSTGKPKGVPNVHEGIVNRLLWMQDAYRLDGTDRVMQKTPYSFDVSVWEFFWPLMTGACLVVARPEGHMDPTYLVDLVVRQKITTMHFVPSMLRIFLESEGVEQCTSLRRVICSGEALPFDLQERFFERLGAELHNLYGPTEASVDVSYWQCTPDSGRSTVPIGRPIWNTQLYVLDRYMQPVPIGIAGELHIGGVGLARGYMKRPELTAEKFLPDPFSREPGARLYKTGDLTRFLPDGNIEYLGRIDHQVKIRGFRIELGEIETALDSHPGIRQTVVMAREDEPGDKRLVAYVVPDPGYNGSEEPGADGELSAEQVSQWAMTFDEAYQRGGEAADATFNIAGWDSSYTGQPIPPEEMRVWVDTTVDRIIELKPKRVWEIGCGTGLLLLRVAPQCEYYFGTDVSRAALSSLDGLLQRPGLKLPQVKLDARPAHQFDESTKGQFDAVVLNSVVQYFPDIEYLVEVLQGAVESVGSGGAVFIGDVRSFPLLETFHASVQLVQAPDSLTAAQFRQRVHTNVGREGELLIDPEFFTALRRRIPEIGRVEIQLKRGRAQNELARFRYDVVLHVGPAASPQPDCAWLDWNKQGLTPELLREILQKTEPDVLGLTGVPNARLQPDAEALRLLSSTDGPETVGGLREMLRQAPPAPGVEPEDLFGIERELPYKVEIRASRTAVDGFCNVVFRRRSPQGGIAEHAIPRFPGESDLARPWEALANNPLRQKVAAKLVPQVRRWLGDKLPEYMVPSVFVLLDSMPLSANGKVNRQALPAPELSRAQLQGEYLAPRTPAEEMIAAIFADVLRLERVGVTDDFFELGGHSLSATQVIARLRQAFRVEFPLRVLFESPTVAGLARALDDIERGRSGMIVPPLVPAPRDRALPLSFAQQRLWVLDQIEPNNPLYNVPRPIRMKGTLDARALEIALNGIVKRHEILRTTYQMENGQPVQAILPELHIPLEAIDFTGERESVREKEARGFAEREAARPFNLAADPILRTFLLKLAADDHILLLNSHHIANDGWSNVVFTQDLSALYQAALEGKPSPLPELPVQYADYAVWQRNWLQGEVLENQLAYWKFRLDGAPPVLSLPTDRPRPAVQSFRGAVQDILLPDTLLDGIRTLSRQEGVTSFMTMLAAFNSLLAYYTRQTDLVVGTDVAGRTNMQTEALIGFFVNLLVMRTDLSGDPSYKEILGRVRETALGSYAHQDVPFDKLVQELRPERSLSHNPLVQVLFVQQNTLQNSFTLPGLELSAFKLSLPSKFDMAVFVRETDHGIPSLWVYNPDLFDATTIARMAGLFQIVLEKATANPEIKLSGLIEALAETEHEQRASEHKQFQETSLQKLKSVKRKAITGV